MFNPSQNGRSLPVNRVLGPDGQPWGGPEIGTAIPHVATFASILGQGWRAYQQSRYDEALRAGREEALSMRRDAFLMGIFNERKYGTVSLKWHIDVDNERDPEQKAVKDGLTQIVRRIPRFQSLLWYLLEAVWYGRYGSQLVWHWKEMSLPAPAAPTMGIPGMDPGGTSNSKSKRRAMTVQLHQPVNGDKIGHLYDGTPTILVHSTEADKLPDSDTVWTDMGHALALRGTWRSRFIIHRHEAVDADFFDVDAAEAIHGLGVRSILYWVNYMRQEWLANVADWCQRTGLGVRLWYYQGGNKKSKEEVSQAASAQSDKVNILIPRFGDRPQEGVEYVDTASTGAELLLRLQEHLEKQLERYIIGQSLSSSADGGGLGGTGVADFQASTKAKIIAFDARNLEDTLTEDLLEKIKYWTYPEHRDMPVRFVFEVDQPNPTEMMGAVSTYIGLGGEVRDDDVRSIIGLAAPEDGDKILKRQEIPVIGGEGEEANPLDALMGPMSPEDEQLSQELFDQDANGVDDAEEPIDDSEPIQFGKPGQPRRYNLAGGAVHGEPQPTSLTTNATPGTQELPGGGGKHPNQQPRPQAAPKVPAVPAIAGQPKAMQPQQPAKPQTLDAHHAAAHEHLSQGLPAHEAVHSHKRMILDTYRQLKGQLGAVPDSIKQMLRDTHKEFKVHADAHGVGAGGDVHKGMAGHRDKLNEAVRLLMGGAPSEEAKPKPFTPPAPDAREGMVKEHGLSFQHKPSKYSDSDDVSGGRLNLKNAKGKSMGEATYHRDGMAKLQAAKFPGIDKEALDQGVYRMSGIEVNDTLRGKGVGAELYLRALNSAPGDRPYFYNSQVTPFAQASLQKLADQGLIEHHKNPRDDQQHFKRITKAGQEYLKQIDAGRGEALSPKQIADKATADNVAKIEAQRKADEAKYKPAKSRGLSQSQLDDAKSWMLESDWTEDDLAKMKPERVAELIDKKYPGGLKDFKANNPDEAKPVAMMDQGKEEAKPAHGLDLSRIKQPADVKPGHVRVYRAENEHGLGPERLATEDSGVILDPKGEGKTGGKFFSVLREDYDRYATSLENLGHKPKMVTEDVPEKDLHKFQVNKNDLYTVRLPHKPTPTLSEKVAQAKSAKADQLTPAEQAHESTIASAFKPINDHLPQGYRDAVNQAYGLGQYRQWLEHADPRHWASDKDRAESIQRWGKDFKEAGLPDIKAKPGEVAAAHAKYKTPREAHEAAANEKYIRIFGKAAGLPMDKAPSPHQWLGLGDGPHSPDEVNAAHAKMMNKLGQEVNMAGYSYGAQQALTHALNKSKTALLGITGGGSKAITYQAKADQPKWVQEAMTGHGKATTGQGSQPELADHIASLYHNAAKYKDTPKESIEQAFANLESANLSGAQLKALAEQLNANAPGLSKKALIAAMKEAVLGRRGAAMRVHYAKNPEDEDGPEGDDDAMLAHWYADTWNAIHDGGGEVTENMADHVAHALSPTDWVLNHDGGDYHVKHKDDVNTKHYAKGMHSPPGGVVVAGEYFSGGRFIPASKMAQATEEDKNASTARIATHKGIDPEKIKEILAKFKDDDDDPDKKHSRQRLREAMARRHGEHLDKVLGEHADAAHKTHARAGDPHKERLAGKLSDMAGIAGAGGKGKSGPPAVGELAVKKDAPKKGAIVVTKISRKGRKEGRIDFNE